MFVLRVNIKTMHDAGEGLTLALAHKNTNI